MTWVRGRGEASPFCGCRWRRQSRCRCRARRSASQTHWTLPGCQYNSRQSTFRKSHVWAWKLSFLNIAIPYGWLWNNTKAQFVNFGCQALSTPEYPRWRGKHPCEIFLPIIHFPSSFITRLWKTNSLHPFSSSFPISYRPPASKTATLSMSGIKDKSTVTASELIQGVQLSEYRTVDQINTSFQTCARDQQTTAAML